MDFLATARADDKAASADFFEAFFGHPPKTAEQKAAEFGAWAAEQKAKAAVTRAAMLARVEEIRAAIRASKGQ